MATLYLMTKIDSGHLTNIRALTRLAITDDDATITEMLARPMLMQCKSSIALEQHMFPGHRTIRDFSETYKLGHSYGIETKSSLGVVLATGDVIIERVENDPHTLSNSSAPKTKYSYYLWKLI